jgi:4a-hydroxytetrahydrobiopterin dehydratase
VKIFKGQELLDAVMGAPGWSVEGGELVRTETFKDFVEAMEFVNRVAEMAEAAGHHPDIDIRYNKVRLGLVTHDAGGITDKDIELAREVAAAAVETE